MLLPEPSWCVRRHRQSLPRIGSIFLAAVIFLCTVSTASAQHQNQQDALSSDTLYVPSIDAVYRNGEISIDGRINEAAWQQAVPATRFVQQEPVEGAPPGEPTEVRVLYDDRALYVGAIMYDSKPHLIGAQLVRRDESGQFDYFNISIDPNNDRRTGYRFRVSAAGVQRDEYLFDDTDDDEAWNAVWVSAVHRDSTGWSVELRIPLSQIRYNTSEEEQSWGVNFRRRRLSSNETIDFALESRVRHGVVSVFGRLNGLRLPKAARRMELRPYALTSALTGPSTPGNPFFDGSELDRRLGLDMRYGLGTSYTLDLTLNPDFGQVEVDPAVVNLSAFEVFFQEKRPFFVSDAQVFDFDLSGRRSTLFYSRRIGRQPHLAAPDGSDFNDIPTQTAILGAAKVTGRSSSGLSVGVLTAVTGRETGEAYTTGTDVTDKFTVEPRTEYGVVRAQQDFRRGATQVGAIATTMHRELPNDGSFDFLSSNAFSAGLDFEHNWGGQRARDWAFSGFFAGSHVRGSTTALTQIQEASNHFFQRPDATRFSLDPNATSMTGYNWRMYFERQSAAHWTWEIWGGQVSPGFEVNDMGFSTSSERIDAGGEIQYREIKPGRIFRNYRFSLFNFNYWRHEALDDAFSPASWKRAYKEGTFWGSADLEFLNFWELELDAGYDPERMSNTATRGGPLMKLPARPSLGIELSTDRRKIVSFRPQLDYEMINGGGHELRVEMRTSIRPSSSWEFEFEPGYRTEENPAQYVTQTDNDVGYAPTFGRRYIFADLQRRSFSFESRINITFTPRLTLQLYAQPLLSSGKYLTYKQLARAESFDFDVFEEGTRTFIDPNSGERHIDFDGDGASDFSFEGGDFNIRSLRVNMVLRWEYRPGSTVFLVWQQSRSNEFSDGSFRFGRDFRGLFDGDSENIFIVKFNYWFGM